MRNEDRRGGRVKQRRVFFRKIRRDISMLSVYRFGSARLSSSKFGSLAHQPARDQRAIQASIAAPADSCQWSSFNWSVPATSQWAATSIQDGAGMPSSVNMFTAATANLPVTRDCKHTKRVAAPEGNRRQVTNSMQSRMSLLASSVSCELSSAAVPAAL